MYNIDTKKINWIEHIRPDGFHYLIEWNDFIKITYYYDKKNKTELYFKLCDVENILCILRSRYNIKIELSDYKNKFVNFIYNLLKINNSLNEKILIFLWNYHEYTMLNNNINDMYYRIEKYILID